MDIKGLQEKIAGIAGKYADLVEKQIDAALEGERDVDFEKINEGIRMMNHVSAALCRVGAYEKEKIETPNC